MYIVVMNLEEEVKLNPLLKIEGNHLVINGKHYTNLIVENELWDDLPVEHFRHFIEYTLQGQEYRKMGLIK